MSISYNTPSDVKLNGFGFVPDVRSVRRFTASSENKFQSAINNEPNPGDSERLCVFSWETTSRNLRCPSSCDSFLLDLEHRAYILCCASPQS